MTLDLCEKNMDEEEVATITVVSLKENEDGSANLEIEASHEAIQFLVQEGLIAILKKAISKNNEEYSLITESPELLKGDN